MIKYAVSSKITLSVFLEYAAFHGKFLVTLLKIWLIKIYINIMHNILEKWVTKLAVQISILHKNS